MAPITEAADTASLTIDWDVRLPAFPIDQSSAILIGKVTSAAAYLSPDRTNVYSEFEVDVEQVFNSSTQPKLTTAQSTQTKADKRSPANNYGFTKELSIEGWS